MDRFASITTRQVDRFCAKWRTPECETVDAFTTSWLGENNWVFPPPHLLPRALRIMTESRANGTVIIPYWPSAAWWPLLVKAKDTFADWVMDWWEIPCQKDTFLPGSVDSQVFCVGFPAYRILALRVCFCGTVFYHDKTCVHHQAVYARRTLLLP